MSLLQQIWKTRHNHPFLFLGSASTATKWALALKLHFLANVPSGYLPVTFRILPGTSLNLFRWAYYRQIWKIQKNLPGSLPETLPGPSGYLPGCSVLQPVENLPVFLPETLPGPSGNLPGCSVFNMHHFFYKKTDTNNFKNRKWIFCVRGFYQSSYIYIYISIYTHM